MPQAIRDQVVDYITYWQNKTELSLSKLIRFLGMHRIKFYQWKERYGQENIYNGEIPRDFWITEEEKEAVVRYYQSHSQEGYRAMTYMMIDDDVAFMSCSSVYRILCEAGIKRSKGSKPSKKGTGFEQPLVAHEQWHTDI